MNKPIITEGATTSHGGEITECVATFKIHGKGVHVDGMSHECPKCSTTAQAIASNHTKSILGKAIVLEGDKTTCGASFIGSQNVASIGGGGDSEGYVATYGEPNEGGGGLDGFGNYNPQNPNEHWAPDEQKMLPGKPAIIIDSNQAAVDHYYNGNGEAVELGATTKSLLRNHDRQKGALTRLKSGITDKDGFYRVDMTWDMFHVGRTGVEYDTKCNKGMCTTTFKGFQQKNKTTGRVYPDAFVDPVDLGFEVGGTPYDYKPYVWKETYPDNFTGKKQHD